MVLRVSHCVLLGFVCEVVSEKISFFTLLKLSIFGGTCFSLDSNDIVNEGEW